MNTHIERTKEAKQNYGEAKKAGNPPQGVVPNFDEIIENSKKQIQEKELENTNIQNKITELSNKKEQAKKDAIDLANKNQELDKQIQEIKTNIKAKKAQIAPIQKEKEELEKKLNNKTPKDVIDKIEQLKKRYRRP